ncbi:MAG TPA: type IV pilus biogenesis/stability protein PilW [Gammaproteobacteria bacterium]|nr:type IV pilus biogenesis/stability protein PilW [Gammaproteobacteria bacterium]
MLFVCRKQGKERQFVIEPIRKARILWAIALVMLLNACAQVNTKPSMRPQPELTPAQINVLLGLRHWRNHHPQLALDRINIALEENPQLASAHNVAGMIYERLGQAALAEQHFKRALALDPNDPSGHNNYGKFLCNQGRLAQAEKQFLSAADHPHNSSPDVAYTNAGLCALRIPDLDRAAQYFTAALNKNPIMPTALFQIARISYEKGRYPQARRNLQQYLQVARHTPETLWLAVQIERALGNAALAQRYAQRLQNTFPHSKETHALFNSEAQLGYTRISPDQGSVQAGPDEVQVIATTGDPFKHTDWVRAQDPRDYTVQLFASQNELAMPYFREKYNLSGEMAYFPVRRGNATWYSLIWGRFDNRQEAEKAISQLPAVIREGAAQVRQFAGIQQELKTQGMR